MLQAFNHIKKSEMKIYHLNSNAEMEISLKTNKNLLCKKITQRSVKPSAIIFLR